MNSLRLLSALALVLFAFPAHAEIPDYVLDRDYQGCLGDDKDPDRATYCACVREGMKNWDLDTYVKTAMQAAASSGSANKVPGKLEELANSCISRVLE
jgi:hypothetical protein